MQDMEEWNELQKKNRAVVHAVNRGGVLRMGQTAPAWRSLCRLSIDGSGASPAGTLVHPLHETFLSFDECTILMFDWNTFHGISW